MPSCIVRWGDGFVTVSPVFPKNLPNQLKYWHRTLERNYGEGLVATGSYRELYKITSKLDDENRYVQELMTMPGFMHRIKTVLEEEGFDYTVIDERTPIPKPDYLKAFEGLRDYQLECAYVAIASGGGIIACPTGWGKTHIIASIINAYSHAELCARNTPIIVVATPEKDITRKDYNDLKTLLPDREVGIAMSGVKRTLVDDVQVITLNSLHLLNMEDVGIIIVDEVHTAASEKRSNVILSARKAMKWGVSATPTGRYDGRDLVTEGLFGPVVYRRTYAEGIKDGALVPITVYWIPAPAPGIGLERYLRYKTHAGKYRQGVDRNTGLNALIGNLMTQIPNEYQTLCIMRHLDQMNRLMDYCPDVVTVHAESSQDKLTSSQYHNLAPITSRERNAIYDAVCDGRLRKVMSTYVYKQGVNFPELQIIVNAGGGGSEIIAEQIPGRESRNIEKKETAYLIDFWHPWDTVADKRGRRRPGPIHKDDRARERVYNELGFGQIWLDSINELPFLEPRNG